MKPAFIESSPTFDEQNQENINSAWNGLILKAFITGSCRKSRKLYEVQAVAVGKSKHTGEFEAEAPQSEWVFWFF